MLFYTSADTWYEQCIYFCPNLYILYIISLTFPCVLGTLRQCCRSVLLPKCLTAEVSGNRHFSTGCVYNNK